MAPEGFRTFRSFFLSEENCNYSPTRFIDLTLVYGFKIVFEESNGGVIHLYLEGMFWKAYECRAFAFCARITRRLSVISGESVLGPGPRRGD